VVEAGGAGRAVRGGTTVSSVDKLMGAVATTSGVDVRVVGVGAASFSCYRGGLGAVAGPAGEGGVVGW
jgi:hypothetical protein